MLPQVNVHRHCRIQNAVIDKDCEIPAGTIIGEDIEADRRRFHVDESGIVLVTPEMLGQNIHMTR